MTHARTRLVILLESLKRGGVQQGVLLQAPRLDPSKYAVQVWALRTSGKDAALAEEFHERGIEVKPAPARGFHDHTGLLGLARMLREERVDLINTRSFMPNIIGRIAARLAGVPIVVAQYHHTYEHRWRKKYLTHERLLRDGTDSFVCVSRAVRRYLQPLLGLPEKKIKVIYNGLDLESFDLKESQRDSRASLGLPAESRILAYIGRLTAIKDVAVLIQAASRVIERIPETSLVIVGEGEERRALEEKAASAGLADAVRFLGSRRDIPRILNAVDCVALPSRAEGFPRIVLEAFASRTPLVSTPAGGVPEIARDHDNALLVTFSDPAKLTEAIIETLENPEQTDRRRERAFRDVQEFSLGKWVAQTEENFDALIAGLRGRIENRRSDAQISDRMMQWNLWNYRLSHRLSRIFG